MGQTTITPDDGAARAAATQALAKGWWLFLLRGVAGILLGLLVLANPGAGLLFVLTFIAVWAIFDGVASLVHAVRGEPDPSGRHRSRTWLTLDGIASVLFGILVLMAPGLSAVLLTVAVGAWAMVRGCCASCWPSAWEAGRSGCSARSRCWRACI